MSYLQQFQTLRNSLPRLAVGLVNNENCEFCNYIDACKDCYLIVSAYHSEKCMYGKFNFFCYFCIDNHYLENCELCYQCNDCKKCYNCSSLQDCENSTDCEFCIFCKGCSNCFGSINLRQKKYYIFNKPYPKEDYEKKIKEIKEKGSTYIQEEFEKIKKSYPHPPVIEENNENCTGHHIINNKNLENCYDTKESQDCINSHELYSCHDCADILVGDYACFCYDCVSAYKLENSNFCYNCWESADLEYCEQCYQCDSCFLSCNLKHKKYYILNKPYEKDEYFKEKARRIEKMRNDGQYGKWLPPTYPLEDSMANC